MSEFLPLSYLRIWAQKNQMVVSIERNSSDKYLISKDGVFLQMPDQSLAPPNTRQVFPVLDRFPSLLTSDLVLKGSTPTRQFFLSATRPTGERTSPKLLTFEQVREEVESYLSLLTHLDSLQMYVAIRAYENGLVSLPHLHRVAGMLSPVQTLGTLLLQQNLCSWEDLLAVCLDLKRTTSPSGNFMKSGGRQPGPAEPVRSTDFELCGEILVALGRVSRTQLEEAIRAKSTGDRPLGAILVEMGACTQSDVDNALRAQSEMKSTEYGSVGLLGELLVEGGFVRHEDVYEALRMQKIARQRLDGILVSMGLCSSEHIQDYRLRYPGGVSETGEVNEEKLAEYVVLANLCTPLELEEALRLQKRGRQLLGELLVNLKRCTEQDIQRALSTQKNRRKTGKKEPERIGELLVSKRIVTEQVVQQAAEIQRVGRERLGSTLINLGACTEDDFQKALELQFSWRESSKRRDDKLGEELLKDGLVNEQDLSRALDVHCKAGKPLGQILVETGFCTPEVVIDTLVRRDERRRAAFAMMIQQHAPCRQRQLSDVESGPRRVTVPGGTGVEPQPSKSSGLMQKVSSWLFKKDHNV